MNLFMTPQTPCAPLQFDALLLQFSHRKFPDPPLPIKHLLFIQGLAEKSSLCEAFLGIPLKLNLVFPSNGTYHALHCFRIADYNVSEGSCVIRKHLIHLCIPSAWGIINTQNAFSLARRKGAKQEVLILNKTHWIKFQIDIVACSWCFSHVQEVSGIAKGLFFEIYRNFLVNFNFFTSSQWPDFFMQYLSREGPFTQKCRDIMLFRVWRNPGSTTSLDFQARWNSTFLLLWRQGMIYGLCVLCTLNNRFQSHLRPYAEISIQEYNEGRGSIPFMIPPQT